MTDAGGVWTEDDAGGRLCLRGRQHVFVVVGWDAGGAESLWAYEMVCPTCGTELSRDQGTDPWRWIAPEREDR
jgi:hypothetical protein